MSTGGVFTIIANDGKADKMIMATDLLRQRIEQVKCARRAANAKGLPGYEDDTPTLVDVERSHILYVNAHFKPFAAIGYEYQKVGPQQGTANFGTSAQVTYSIPQFGDFFYDMVLNLNIPAVTATSVAVVGNASVPAPYLPTVKSGDPAFGATVASGASRTTLALTYYDASGAVVYSPTVTPSARPDFIRYCEFPAMRTVAGVQFTVNGNPLDQYDSNTYAYYEQFRVRPGKRVGWDRGVGQQVAKQGYGDLTFPNTQTVEGDPSGTSSVSGASYTQVQYSVVDGAQTPQPTQPIQDWWIKLLLWFNEDVRLSVPSVSIPYGQRFIVINFANITDVLFTTGAGLISQLVTTKTTYTGVAGNTGGGAGTQLNYASAVDVSIVRTPIALGSQILALTGSGFNKADLYINNIFVNPEIHDIYIKRIGFNLIRVHRIQKTFVNTPGQQILLSQLKWPIEYFFAGIRPLENESVFTGTGQWVWRNWHRFTQCVARNISQATQLFNIALPQTTVDTAGAVGAVVVTLANTDASLGRTNTTVTYEGGNNNILFWDEYNTIDSLEISAHQIPIYKFTPSPFFNNHIPLQFGGVNIQTPTDQGALMINFCLYPGTYQPSGHFNISRAREFYFNYTSSLITSSYTGNLLIDASALNFLLISDGSAVLRYST